MLLQSLCRDGRGRVRPTAQTTAPRGAPGGAWAVAVALALLLAPPAWAKAADDAATATPAEPVYLTTDELHRLQYVGRAQPDVASAALLRYADTLKIDDPRYIETLLEVGSEYVGLNRGDDVEQIAVRIDALSDRMPLAAPAAMLLRAQWTQAHGALSKAEHQIIDASALLPADAPEYLRLRLLMSSAYLKNRSGHYDEAMLRYNQALKLADETGQIWRRVDLRASIAQVLADAGQVDKAAEINREQMRMAVNSDDDYAISAAYSTRAILRSRGGDDSADVLADWRTALEHARLGGNRHQIVMNMANIAHYYLVHGDLQTAYELSQQALRQARQANDLSAQSLAIANTGLALIGMKRKNEGLPMVREANRIDERAGTATNISDSQREVGGYLERAGYLQDALAAYHQYRQLSDELNQQDRQRALIELQESFANEARRHELDMLAREGRLKDEEILHHDLQIKQWTAAGVASLLLLALVAVLAGRLRARNRLLSVSNEQLRLQAEIDPLTGLSNRHHLQVKMAERPGPGLEGTLYLLDVDHFKQINDQCGHAGGDAVLVEIARRLRHTLRDGDLLVRWGGEEFLVLVPRLPRPEAEALAKRLLCALADAPVMHDGKAVPVSASIGFGLFPMRSSAPQADLALDWERAISLVDTAMYLAKAHGRNAACGVLRVDAADAPAVEAIVEQLDASVRDGRIELQFQHGPGLRFPPASAERPLESSPVPAHRAEVS